MKLLVLKAGQIDTTALHCREAYGILCSSHWCLGALFFTSLLASLIVFHQSGRQTAVCVSVLLPLTHQRGGLSFLLCISVCLSSACSDIYTFFFLLFFCWSRFLRALCGLDILIFHLLCVASIQPFLTHPLHGNSLWFNLVFFSLPDHHLSFQLLLCLLI